MNTSVHKIEAAKQKHRRTLLLASLGGVLVTVAILAFLLFTNGVKLEITPKEAADKASITIISGLGITLGHDLYSLTGDSRIRVSSPGYIPEVLQVKSADQVNFIEIYLKEAPAHLTLSTIPASPESRWLINGGLVAVSSSYKSDLARNSYRITVDNPYYLPEERDVRLQAGETRTEIFNLRPLSGMVKINTTPPGATIDIDRNSIGLSPQTYKISGGKYDLAISHPKYQTIHDILEITNRKKQVTRNYKLIPKQALISFELTPPDGILMLDGLAISQRADLPVSALSKHIILYSKPGYIARRRTFSPEPDSKITVKLHLKKQFGIVQINNNQNAVILVNGKFAGLAPQELKLQTLPRVITLTKAGYRAKVKKITPDSSLIKRLDITLQTELQARLAESPKLKKNKAGITLALFIPDSFTMGAPRSEPGQRANEFQKSVVLTKAFYASVTEITVAQFARFSGKSFPKADARLPVTNVTWEQAAQFCNWLSRMEGLQPVYHFRGGKMISATLNGDGYRLPTEAEWEWLARKAGRQRESRFPWGDSSIIPKSSGNLADETAKSLVKRYIPNYNDGYEKLAPVGSFSKNPSGLHDLAGNVSEWVHDYYDLSPPRLNQIFQNPSGPERGRSHVIKGSNWRSGTLTELRAAFRDTATAGRDDLGFRVVRYLYGKETENGPQ